jgi:hypothetical protein
MYVCLDLISIGPKSSISLVSLQSPSSLFQEEILEEPPDLSQYPLMVDLVKHAGPNWSFVLLGGWSGSGGRVALETGETWNDGILWDLGNANWCAWRFLCIFSKMQPERVCWKWKSGAFDMKMRCWGQRWPKCCVYLFIFFPVPAFSPTWTDSQLSILQVSEKLLPLGITPVLGILQRLVEWGFLRNARQTWGKTATHVILWDLNGFNMIYIMRFACTLMVIKWDSPYVSLT